MPSPGLELRGIRFAFGAWDMALDLAVAHGGLTALLGASGAGKSTLLAIAAGFERPLAGETLVDGRDVTALPPAERPITTLFQDHNLFPHLPAAENVALGLDPGLRLNPGQRAAAAAALDRVGLAGKSRRLPRQLSGGERQRVAIARALVMRRPVLLLDEPFAALGPALRREMLALVDALRRDTGMTVLMVTHDPADARRVAETVAFMHEGRILASGPTGDMLDRPGPAGTCRLSRRGDGRIGPGRRRRRRGILTLRKRDERARQPVPQRSPPRASAARRAALSGSATSSLDSNSAGCRKLMAISSCSGTAGWSSLSTRK